MTSAELRPDDFDAQRSSYTERYPYHDENLRVLAWYTERMLDVLRERQPRSVVSLGIGHGTVATRFIAGLPASVESYTIVEGSADAIATFDAEVRPPAHVKLVHSWFEEFAPAAHVDAIEMGFVLEHVEDPLALVRRYREYLTPGGTMFLSVPNARSLHRLIGHEAGLLEDLYALSEYDHLMGHRRFFDLASFSTLIEEAGLTVVHCEGIFLKPITTAQQETLGLSEEVLRALCAVGVDHPDLCNAVLVEATC